MSSILVASVWRWWESLSQSVTMTWRGKFMTLKENVVNVSLDNLEACYRLNNKDRTISNFYAEEILS